jgi:hypothetical protein
MQMVKFFRNHHVIHKAIDNFVGTFSRLIGNNRSHCKLL